MAFPAFLFQFRHSLFFLLLGSPLTIVTPHYRLFLSFWGFPRHFLEFLSPSCSPQFSNWRFSPVFAQAATIGDTKGGLNNKLTALVVTHGRELQLTLAPGNRADVKLAEQIWAPAGKRVVADNGYDSDPFREALKAEGATSSIPPRYNRTAPPPFHSGYYRLRHHAEIFFQRNKRCRAVGTLHNRLDLHFLASVQLLAILDLLIREV